jgi:hypothetical protein
MYTYLSIYCNMVLGRCKQGLAWETGLTKQGLGGFSYAR